MSCCKDKYYPCCGCGDIVIGITGPQGVRGPTGIAETINVGLTKTITAGSKAVVYDRTGSPNHIFDFEIPKGDKGDKGETGDGLQILGTLDTIDDLPDNPNNGDAYLIGVVEPRTLYIYNQSTLIWIDHGELTGPQGEDGATPEIGENGNWFIDGVDTEKPSRGEKGETGEQGIQGLQGVKGDNGENGINGEDGTNGITPIIGENGNWFLETQDTGKPSRGATGPELIKEAYFVTLNDPDNTIPVDGLEIASGARLPIKRKEVDTANLFVLDKNDNTIQFNQTGTYEVLFSTNAYVHKTGGTFDASTDFVSIGFRAVDSPIVFAGANTWSSENIAINTVGMGIFEVRSIAEPFELVNLQKKPVFINGGKIEQVITDSYFSCPIVSILIKKLY